METYVCSNCGDVAGYDGRCGDGPYLVCECTKDPQWINDGRGGYHVYKNDAHAIPAGTFKRKV